MDVHAPDRTRRTRLWPASASLRFQSLDLGRRLLNEPRRPQTVRNSPRARWYVVATVCVGAFMGQLDVSIVTVALPRIGADLHADAALVQWVALAYLLALVCALVTIGALADRIGRKLLYTYGFIVFAAGSALCSVAPALGWLVAARILQGFGAAMLQANSVALIAESLPRRELARGLGVQGAAQAVGLALGPAVGGLLLAAGGWRLIFLVNVPAGVLGIALGWFLLPRSRGFLRGGRFDGLGALLMAITLGALMLLISLARVPLGDQIDLGLLGPMSPSKLALGALALVAGAALVLRERRVPAPILDLGLLRGRALRVGLGCALASYLVMFGTLYVIPYYLSAIHASSVSAGLRLASLPLALGIAAPLAGRAAAHARASLLGAVGLALAAAGLVGLAFSPAGVGLVAGLTACGAGLGVFMPVNNAAVMAGAPRAGAGALSGVLNTTRGLGTALGVTLAGFVYGAAAHSAAAHAVATPASGAGHGLQVTLVALAAIAVCAAVLALRAGRYEGGQGARVAGSGVTAAGGRVGRSGDPPEGRAEAERRGEISEPAQEEISGAGAELRWATSASTGRVRAPGTRPRSLAACSGATEAAGATSPAGLRQGRTYASQAHAPSSSTEHSTQPSAVVSRPTYFKPEAKITKVIAGRM
jgi:EmrB/QacA subfamily drug resistance transporter